MKALRKNPGGPWQLIEMDNTLKAFQKAVGGYIETVTFAENCCIICNEEGRLQELPYNCTIMGCDFVGTILCVSTRKDEFEDVSQNIADLFMEENK